MCPGVTLDGFYAWRGLRRPDGASAARMGLLADLFVLLMGFALLSRHFEAAEARRDACILPGDWKGGLVLLVLAFVLWAFLDDIPAALIGGTMARHVFRGKVHIGHQAAIVAASTADCGSVVGDTTTSSDVDRRISPLEVLDAYVGAGALLMRTYRPAPAPGKLHSQLARLFERLPFNSADRGLCRRPAAVGRDHGRERKFVGPDHRWKDGGARGAPVPVMINERAVLRDQAAAGSPLLNFTGIFR